MFFLVITENMEDYNQFFLYFLYFFFMTINVIYYSFKIFPRYWLAKSTPINSPKPTTDDQIWKNFVFNEPMTSEVQHSCRLRHRYREDLGTRFSCFGCENKNSRTFCGTFYSFHYDLLSKNLARRQLDGQNLLFGVYLQTWTGLYRGELDIEEGKHVFFFFFNSLFLN